MTQVHSRASSFFQRGYAFLNDPASTVKFLYNLDFWLAIKVDTRSRKKLLCTMFPDMKPELIDEILRLIDNPPELIRALPDVGRLPLMSYKAHRVAGHSILAALVITLKTRKLETFAVVLAHYGQDIINDLAVKYLGWHQAKIIEYGIIIALTFYSNYKSRRNVDKSNGGLHLREAYFEKEWTDHLRDLNYLPLSL